MYVRVWVGDNMRVVGVGENVEVGVSVGHTYTNACPGTRERVTGGTISSPIWNSCKLGDSMYGMW